MVEIFILICLWKIPPMKTTYILFLRWVLLYLSSDQHLFIQKDVTKLLLKHYYKDRSDYYWRKIDCKKSKKRMVSRILLFYYLSFIRLRRWTQTQKTEDKTVAFPLPHPIIKNVTARFIELLHEFKGNPFLVRLSLFGIRSMEGKWHVLPPEPHSDSCATEPI